MATFSTFMIWAFVLLSHDFTISYKTNFAKRVDACHFDVLHHLADSKIFSHTEPLLNDH